MSTKPSQPKVPSWIWLAYILFILTLIGPFLLGMLRALADPSYPYHTTEVSASAEIQTECRTRLTELARALDDHLLELPAAQRSGEEATAAAWREDTSSWKNALDLLAARCHLTNPDPNSPSHQDLAAAYRAMTAIHARAADSLTAYAQERTALLLLLKSTLSF